MLNDMEIKRQLIEKFGETEIKRFKIKETEETTDIFEEIVNKQLWGFYEYEQFIVDNKKHTKLTGKVYVYNSKGCYLLYIDEVEEIEKGKEILDCSPNMLYPNFIIEPKEYNLIDCYKTLLFMNINPFNLDSEHTKNFSSLVEDYINACKESKCYLLGGLVENEYK